MNNLNNQPASEPGSAEGIHRELFHRTALLLGADGMRAIHSARGIVFGIGGVGSWCAESLVRTGVGQLTLVDSDRICVTNINRQLQATCATIGQVKVEALRARLLEINPRAEIVAVRRLFDAHSADDFHFDGHDFVVDAIDSLSAKALLISRASHSRAFVVASLGAAAKLDPTRVRVAEFWRTTGCPLGAMLRKRMRRQGLTTGRPVPTVYSDEVVGNAGGDELRGAAGPRHDDGCGRKAVINGSLAHMTGLFGLTLAGLVIQHLVRPPVDRAGSSDPPGC